MRGRIGPPATDAAASAALLAHLRREAGAPELSYAEPPAELTGGYDTRIFTFRLAGASAAWSGPLVLRVQNPGQDPVRSLREATTQNTLAALGYPVPHVLVACADRAVLGAGFLVMERTPGRPLLAARRAGVGRALAEAQARLHALDPEPLLRALDETGRAAGGEFSRDTVSFERHLTTLEELIQRAGLTGLADGVQWLVDRRPPPGPRVICHGDFHPLNLLAMDGRVTAVLDWPNVVVAEAEYDVASTHVLLGAVPVALLPVPAGLRPVVAVLRHVLLARYLTIYRRLRPLDPVRMPYYEAAACMRGLVRVAAERAGTDAARLSALDASAFGERLAARFAHVSGVPVTLPRARG